MWEEHSSFNDREGESNPRRSRWSIEPMYVLLVVFRRLASLSILRRRVLDFDPQLVKHTTTAKGLVHSSSALFSKCNSQRTLSLCFLASAAGLGFNKSTARTYSPWRISPDCSHSYDCHAGRLSNHLGDLSGSSVVCCCVRLVDLSLQVLWRNLRGGG